MLRFSQIIFVLAVCASVVTVDAYKWSTTQRDTAADNDVSLVDNPAGVNLAAALIAVSQKSLDFFGTNRTKNLDVDRKATVIVQKKADLSTSLEVQVEFKDADDGYCNPDVGAWPGVFAVALKKAGWDLSKSIPVPEALQAITGLKPATFYDCSNAPSNVTNGTFKDVVLKPIRSNESPLVVQTRNQSFHDLKANYAYALYVSRTIFKEDNKNELILTDPDGHAQRIINATDVYDATEYIFGTKTGLLG